MKPLKWISLLLRGTKEKEDNSSAAEVYGVPGRGRRLLIRTEDNESRKGENTKRKAGWPLSRRQPLTAQAFSRITTALNTRFRIRSVSMKARSDRAIPSRSFQSGQRQNDNLTRNRQAAKETTGTALCAFTSWRESLV